MPVEIIPNGERIWQSVARAYRPPNRPFALYAEDERIGEFHAGTLAINFQVGVNTLSMHNAWLTGDWFGGYPLRLPQEGRFATFPSMVTPQQAADGIGYSLVPGSAPIVPPVPTIPQADVPAWVQAYYNYLQNQIDVYGYIVRRELRPEFAR